MEHPNEFKELAVLALQQAEKVLRLPIDANWRHQLKQFPEEAFCTKWNKNKHFQRAFVYFVGLMLYAMETSSDVGGLSSSCRAAREAQKMFWMVEPSLVPSSPQINDELLDFVDCISTCLGLQSSSSKKWNTVRYRHQSRPDAE
ncbi:hypothetical protein BDV33DRAFT_210141 [Aspergillus novoparasiticus]|uniref:Uncharacterized protein n=1 Tax=Aspergillus novoparasiticus TaxID=986946 RepID=A0A5N6E8U5_9EURO|nr:hypothetical protein BDV33DRAFT_210141 [Aspergillus novoparasiticus]